MQVLLKILSLFYYCFLSLVLKFIPRKLRYKSIIGESVVITGGANGLGRALALMFAKFGTNIALLDIDESALNQTKNVIETQFMECLVKTYVCDITDRHLVKKTAEQINKDMGMVSILVNNAGVLYGKSILKLTDENIINTFNINTLSNFWTIRQFLPNMLTANKGHIVTIASIGGKIGCVQMTDYCGSKHALIGLNESLRLELSMKPNNQIKTTVVLPTFFRTNLINGVKPNFAITILDVNQVAQEIIDAVLTEQELITIPYYLQLLFILQSILPTRTLNVIYDIIGGYQVMNDFKGKSN